MSNFDVISVLFMSYFKGIDLFMSKFQGICVWFYFSSNPLWLFYSVYEKFYGCFCFVNE